MVQITQIKMRVLVILLSLLGTAALNMTAAKAQSESRHLQTREKQTKLLSNLVTTKNVRGFTLVGKLRGAVGHKKKSIVALQESSSSAHLKTKGASKQQTMSKMAKKRAAKRAARSERTYFSKLITNLRVQASQKSNNIAHKHHRVNLCNGNQYAWMVEIRAVCTDSFGDESVWDQGRGEGGCAEAWEECNSDFASTCCTQPEGPSNMEAYCARAVNAEDRACAVQNRMSGVTETMGGIRDAVGVLDTAPEPILPPSIFSIISGECRILEGGRCVASPGWPEGYGDDEECEIKAPSQGVVHPRVKLVPKNFNTESCCDKLEVGDRVFSGESVEDGPDREIEGGPVMTWSTDFSGPSAGWKVCAEDIIPDPPPPPPPLCLQDRLPPAGGPSPGPSPGPPIAAHLVQVWVPCPSPSPMPAPPGILTPDEEREAARERRQREHEQDKAHSGPRKPTKLEVQCQKLTDLVRKAAENIDAIRTWSAHDGIVAEEGQTHQASHGASAMFLQVMTFGLIGKRNAPAASTSEATDPDLTFAMRRILAVGSSLDTLRDSAFCGAHPNAAGVAEEDADDSDDDADDAGEDDGLDDEGDNATDADDEGEGAMSEKPKVNGSAVAGLLEFEGKMTKTNQAFEKGVHPHGNKWWRYRYEYTLVESFVLAFSVMFLYLVMWFLSGASFFDRFKFYNIGLSSRLYRYAWAYFLFHATALMIMVTMAYMLYMPWGKANIFDYCAKELHERIDGRANVPFLGYSWLLMVLDVQFQLFCTFALYGIFILCVTYNWARALNDWKTMMTNASDKTRLSINEFHYNDFEDIMTHRIRGNESFIALFGDKRLRYRLVEGVDSNRQSGFHDFHLHIYFTDAFGRALEYLVEVSLKANLFLAVSALLVAFLAHHYQVAFMYFLPFFIVVCLLGFCVSFVITRHLRDHDHKTSLDFLTVHAYCRSIQLMLYCVFFSFSRLLLSSDIFHDYPNVYLGAFIGLVVTLLLGWFVAPEVMKATICMIMLPHESQEERFGMHLQNVAYWHTVANCHECGVRQHPANACLNREWAGTNLLPSQSPRQPGDSVRASGRDFSFR